MGMVSRYLSVLSRMRLIDDEVPVTATPATGDGIIAWLIPTSRSGSALCIPGEQD